METCQECQVITLPHNQQAVQITKHTDSKKSDFLNYKLSASQNLCNQIFHFRANTRDILLIQIPEETPVCKSCTKLKIRAASENTWKTKQANIPVKLYAPIKYASKVVCSHQIYFTKTIKCNCYEVMIKNILGYHHFE